MRRLFSLILAAAIVYLLLVFPNHPAGLRLSTLSRFPLELPALLLGVAAFKSTRALPIILATVGVIITFLKLADFAMFEAFNRPFNLLIDGFLIKAGFELLIGSIGALLATLAVATALVGLCCLFVALIQSFKTWATLRLTKVNRLGATGLATVFALTAAADTGHVLKLWQLPKNPPGTALTSRVAAYHTTRFFRTKADLAEFSEAAKNDRFAQASGLFDLIGQRDVVIVFVESYGRTSFENPLYTDAHLSILRGAQTRLAQSGLAMRSGWMTSPTSGGQSWLAHSTFSSGLWTSDTGRHHAMLASGRKSLFQLASEAGFRTGAVMPAITQPWPEAEFMGFEEIFAASDMGYQGPPFNWVTMPDQYSLSVYPSLLDDDPRPNFLQIALISSHAPWVPILPVLDWNAIGNGEIFAPYASMGPKPKEVWRDRDRVREQYRKSISYSLEVIFAHIARRSDDMPLFIVLGDHQPAGFVAQIDSLDVPVHMIGPEALLAQIDDWNWTPGLVPDAQTPSQPMNLFRNRFIEAFTSGVQTEEGA